ncbi:ras-related protein Ral-A isoform X2 [Desmodus rotundus]|uniref:ras-related protein Ral-A isoform X2 n=1 Tax=Desmodus rotundus TaxID=9430 RepID=UPI0023813CDA|nr:ras-related protein Ral-A isoform X2 [Desmodus rotundus]
MPASRRPPNLCSSAGIPISSRLRPKTGSPSPAGPPCSPAPRKCSVAAAAERPGGGWNSCDLGAQSPPPPRLLLLLLLLLLFLLLLPLPGTASARLIPPPLLPARSLPDRRGGHFARASSVRLPVPAGRWTSVRCSNPSGNDFCLLSSAGVLCLSCPMCLRERGRERNINVWLPLTWPPTGDVACSPGICPDWESNR